MPRARRLQRVVGNSGGCVPTLKKDRCLAGEIHERKDHKRKNQKSIHGSSVVAATWRGETGRRGCSARRPRTTGPGGCKFMGAKGTLGGHRLQVIKGGEESKSLIGSKSGKSLPRGGGARPVFIRRTCNAREGFCNLVKKTRPGVVKEEGLNAGSSGMESL